LEGILCSGYRPKEKADFDHLPNSKNPDGEAGKVKPIIDVKFDYDESGDVLYVSFGTGEPSYCDEVDDILLVERGILTNSITGFRLLDVRHHKIKSVEVWVRKMERKLEAEKKETPLRNVYVNALREQSVRNRLEKLICA
jgi:hypothetical protein